MRLLPMAIPLRRPHARSPSLPDHRQSIQSSGMRYRRRVISADAVTAASPRRVCVRANNRHLIARVTGVQKLCRLRAQRHNIIIKTEKDPRFINGYLPSAGKITMLSSHNHFHYIHTNYMSARKHKILHSCKMSGKLIFSAYEFNVYKEK